MPHKPKPRLSELECCESPPPPPPSHPPPPDHCPKTTTLQTLKTYCTRASPILFKILTLATFLLATLALWPSIESASDTRRSTGLAEWTSKKEFLDFCEGHGWKGHQCEAVKGYELGPPPGFWSRLRGRAFLRKKESAMVSYGPARVTASISTRTGLETSMPPWNTEAPGGKKNEGVDSEVVKGGRPEPGEGECPNEFFLARRMLLGRRVCHLDVQRREER
ncbi:hypothetical protein QBC44DRAFT_331236 [Cladorrhinum sp. PSN332]|nr:hypothetical protein QBC44DRAFT_331236 [Cladorrhinum sp. PSN332]